MKETTWLLVLGANSDIAIATAKHYADAGYNLYLASRTMEDCEKNAADIRIRYSVQVEALEFDAKAFAAHNDFYTSLPTKPAGVIVAFGYMADQKDAEQHFSQSQAMIDTNYSGSVSILEIIAADFQHRQTGFIVGISSVAGDRGRMSNYIYGSTKAAFSAYLAGLRHRLSHSNVSVLTVKPGFVATKMTAKLDLPAKLTAQPEEVALGIYKGVKNNRAVVYVKPVWRLIMLIIVHLPNFIFHKTKM